MMILEGLLLEGLINYMVEERQVRPYRSEVSVRELTKEGKRTGRSWTERFDTNQRDVQALRVRFQKRISTGAPPPDIAPAQTEEVSLVDVISGIVEQVAHEIAQDTADKTARQLGLQIIRDTALMAAEEFIRQRAWRTRLKRVFKRG